MEGRRKFGNGLCNVCQEEGRRKKEEGRRKKEEGRIKIPNKSIITISLDILWAIVMVDRFLILD
ncbi:hypothetical protein [Microcoleus sp. herbarium2]|uniref:hypothetical protein n=1 Tax=Microcoleus sp. herbarium2 TaxID=3055433 RepID=UPI002FD600C1